VAEVLETLASQRQAGKIRWYGCSNWHTERIREAQVYARAHGLPAFVANQMQWSLAEVDPLLLADKTTAPMNAGMYQYHLESGLAAVPFTSQAGGFFSKLASGRLTLQDSGAFNTPRNLSRLERVRQLSAESGLSITQIILGYLLSQPFATVPIIGPKHLAHLEDSLTAVDIRLTPAQLTFLEA
jgi:aryl-alcohol dehydrogenase-like predicted oxidoreductase